MNDKANTAAPLPECYHTAAGETIEITETDHGQYCVDQWDANGEGRWNKKFDKLSDALVEFERWRYLQAPTDGTPSELESEPYDGVPSPLAETVSDYLKRVYPEYYVRIITNMNRERGPEVAARLLTSPAVPCGLHGAFVWSKSPEGHEFWQAVAQREA